MLSEAFYLFSKSHKDHYAALLNIRKPINAEIESLNKQYMKAQLALFPEQKFFPNANSTMRIAYGEVAGYTNYDSKKMKLYSY
mgnify:CR=1 FL=1